MKLKTFTFLINLMTLSTTGFIQLQYGTNFTKDKVNQYMNIYLANIVKYVAKSKQYEYYYFTLDKDNKVIKATFTGDKNDINEMEKISTVFNNLLNFIIKYKIWKSALQERKINQYNNAHYFIGYTIQNVWSTTNYFAIFDKTKKSISYEKHMFNDLNFKEYIDGDLKTILDKVANTKSLDMDILLDAIKDLNAYALKDLTDDKGAVQLDKYLETDVTINETKFETIQRDINSEALKIIRDRFDNGCEWIKKKNSSSNNPSSKDEKPAVNSESESQTTINQGSDSSNYKGITKRDGLVGLSSALIGVIGTKSAEKLFSKDNNKKAAAAA